MKRLLLLALIATLASCGSQHYIQKAQFDTAVTKSAKKIRKDWNNQEEIDNLKYAYSKANQTDQSRIDYLFESGEENIWAELHQRYSSLQRRQEVVRTLPDEVLSQIGYTYTNYAQKITQSKQNAAEYYYRKGQELMAKNDKYLARDAYTSFLNAKKYYPNYKNVDALISQAKFQGTNHILFRIENQTKVALPEDFETELLKISLKSLNQNWIEYDTKATSGIYYDYYIQLSLKSITSTPNDTYQKEYTEEKEIQDGTKYLLDARGNVAKDSLGNDIKLPVYKIITCKVVETSQYKETSIAGTIDYIKSASGQLMETQEVGAKMIFDHLSAEAYGNKDALTPESLKKVGVSQLPFPTDPAMLMDAANLLKTNAKTIIYNNRNWLKN